MLASVSWLKKYVDISVDTATLAHDMTMLGLNVERIMSSGFDNDSVVIGRVLECERHPDADRLSVCSVDVGSGEPLGIVCGAPNVAAGQTVAVATVGAKLPNGLKIRKSKIRGVVSHGMICSEIELGLGEDAAGIMVLDEGPELGAPLSEVLGGADDVLEIEVTPNRPDQLSHVGVAREIAALYHVPLKVPSVDISSEHAGEPCFSVDIDDPADCYRFTGRVVRGVKVGPSPAWLRQALEGVGLNSINNIVDATNYVMMELGQPMHAYDLNALPARRMGVRRARGGETLRCLDEVEYKLDEHSLIITDGDAPVGVAGVIGGWDTRVTETTTDLLIEAAAFNARVVRRSRKSMNISTDASYRFERGSDRSVCMAASDRLTALIMEIAGGEAGESIDAYPAPTEARSVRIRKENTRRLLGVSLSTEDIAQLLRRLEFEVIDSDDDGVLVSVPSYRDDILEEADLVEEVARLNGYDKIGQNWAFRTTTHAPGDEFDEFSEAVADHLCARGHTEILTSTFTDGTEVELMGWSPDDPRSNPVRVLNPLTSKHSYLRTSLLPGALEVVKRNVDRGVRGLAVFTMGKVFWGRSQEALPDEPFHLLIVRSRPPGSDFWNSSKEGADLYDIKQEVEALLGAARVDAAGRLAYEFDARSGQFRYALRDRAVVEGGVVSARAGAAYDIEQGVWYSTVDLNALFELRQRRAAHKPVSEYPASRRDLSLVTPQGVEYARIQKCLAKHGGRLLESTQVFDVYRGDNLPEGTTAFGVRLSFRSGEKTLTDDEVDGVLEKIVSRLQSELNVVLRS